MPVKSYVNMGGEIFGETSAGVRKNYVRDALGSVVAVTDTSNTKLYTARYKPYGGVLASAGTAPSWTWNGVWGYNSAAGVPHSDFSVRARIYGSEEGRWTRVDPWWPFQGAYGYVGGRVTRWIDPSGLSPCCVAGHKKKLLIILGNPHQEESKVFYGSGDLIYWMQSEELSDAYATKFIRYGWSVSKFYSDKRAGKIHTQTADAVIPPSGYLGDTSKLNWSPPAYRPREGSELERLIAQSDGVIFVGHGRPGQESVSVDVLGLKIPLYSRGTGSGAIDSAQDGPEFWYIDPDTFARAFARSKRSSRLDFIVLEGCSIFGTHLVNGRSAMPYTMRDLLYYSKVVAGYDRGTVTNDRAKALLSWLETGYLPEERPSVYGKRQ